MEYAIYVLFKIDIINHIKTKASLAKNFHIQPSEVDTMPMWEYELYIKQLNSLIEEENERQKQEEKSSGIDRYRKMADPKSIQKYQQQSMPKMPNMSMPKPSW